MNKATFGWLFSFLNYLFHIMGQNWNDSDWKVDENTKSSGGDANTYLLRQLTGSSGTTATEQTKAANRSLIQEKLLQSILGELKLMNQYLALITDEDLNDEGNC